MLEYLKNMLFKKCFNGQNLLTKIPVASCILSHPNISYVTRKRLTKKQKILYDVQIPKKNSVRQYNNVLTFIPARSACVHCTLHSAHALF